MGWLRKDDFFVGVSHWNSFLGRIEGTSYTEFDKRILRNLEVNKFDNSVNEVKAVLRLFSSLQYKNGVGLLSFDKAINQRSVDPRERLTTRQFEALGLRQYEPVKSDLLKAVSEEDYKLTSKGRQVLMPLIKYLLDTKKPISEDILKPISKANLKVLKSVLNPKPTAPTPTAVPSSRADVESKDYQVFIDRLKNTFREFLKKGYKNTSGNLTKFLVENNFYLPVDFNKGGVYQIAESKDGFRFRANSNLPFVIAYVLIDTKLFDYSQDEKFKTGASFSESELIKELSKHYDMTAYLPKAATAVPSSSTSAASIETVQAIRSKLLSKENIKTTLRTVKDGQKQFVVYWIISPSPKVTFTTGDRMEFNFEIVIMRGNKDDSIRITSPKKSQTFNYNQIDLVVSQFTKSYDDLNIANDKIQDPAIKRALSTTATPTGETYGTYKRIEYTTNKGKVLDVFEIILTKGLTKIQFKELVNKTGFWYNRQNKRIYSRVDNRNFERFRLLYNFQSVDTIPVEFETKKETMSSKKNSFIPANFMFHYVPITNRTGENSIKLYTNNKLKYTENVYSTILIIDHGQDLFSLIEISKGETGRDISIRYPLYSKSELTKTLKELERQTVSSNSIELFYKHKSFDTSIITEVDFLHYVKYIDSKLGKGTLEIEGKYDFGLEIGKQYKLNNDSIIQVLNIDFPADYTEPFIKYKRLDSGTSFTENLRFFKEEYQITAVENVVMTTKKPSSVVPFETKKESKKMDKLPVVSKKADLTFPISSKRKPPFDVFGAKTKTAGTVFAVPLNVIKKREDLFQNRKSAYAKRSVDNILNAIATGRFNWALFDSILLFWDIFGIIGKKDEFYVISGHSRLEAFNQTGGTVEIDGRSFAKIPAKVVTSMIIDDIREIALNSNTLGTKESYTERANYYRTLRELGKTKKEINKKAKETEGSNASRIIAFSYLNPNGKAFGTLERLEPALDSNIRNAAKWLGLLRNKYEQLTNAHEDEVWDWLLENIDKKVRSYSEFMEFMERVVETDKFSEGKPLNIKNKKVQTNFDKEFQREVNAQMGEIKKLYTLIENNTKRYQQAGLKFEVIHEKLGGLYSSLTVQQIKLVKLLARKADVKEANKQAQSLFGIHGVPFSSAVSGYAYADFNFIGGNSKILF
jgi:hypothetical protein